MKSAHRHQLETNVLAQRLETYIENLRPYTSWILGGIAALFLLILIASYISGSSATKRSETWDTFNRAASATRPNLDDLHRVAQDHPGTKMQQMADTTWADWQVASASENYLRNRKAAMDALDRATSVYQSVIQSSDDEQLKGRARLGLARIYEMQNHLDKAREQYRLVTGAFADYAKQQALRLDKPEAQETYAWLITAQPVQPKAPSGPGTPGQKLDMSPGEITLPNASGSNATQAPAGKGAAETFNDVLKTMQQEAKPGQAADQKSANGAPATKEAPKPPAPNTSAPESKLGAEPPAADKPESKPSIPPAGEKSAK